MYIISNSLHARNNPKPYTTADMLKTDQSIQYL